MAVSPGWTQEKGLYHCHGLDWKQTTPSPVARSVRTSLRNILGGLGVWNGSAWDALLLYLLAHESSSNQGLGALLCLQLPLLGDKTPWEGVRELLGELECCVSLSVWLHERTHLQKQLWSYRAVSISCPLYSNSLLDFS